MDRRGLDHGENGVAFFLCQVFASPRGDEGFEGEAAVQVQGHQGALGFQAGEGRAEAARFTFWPIRSRRSGRPG